jgi:hypothetical protein
MFLTSSRTQRSSGREKVWKLTPLLPTMHRSALTVALKPSAFRGTSIRFPLSSGLTPNSDTRPVTMTGSRACPSPLWRKKGLDLPLTYGGRTACNHLAVCSGAVRRTTQRSGQVSKRHAPNGYLRRGIGNWTVGSGLVRPTWLLQDGVPSYYRSIYQPTLGRVELRLLWAARSPIVPWTSARIRTDARAHGGGRLAQSCSLGSKVLQPFSCTR